MIVRSFSRGTFLASGKTVSALGLVAAVLVAAQAAAARQSSGAADPAAAAVTAIEHVSVIPMDRERVLDDQTVVVRGDRIEAIGPAAGVEVPTGARRIDGRGKYLLPTLAEMHAHIPGGQASDEQVERVLFLYAAHGIGTIRGMLGHPRHLALRTRAARGELVSPTIYTSGPSLNGTTIPTAEAAAAAVRAQKAAGYDFLKIHPGVPRAAFDALAATAHELALPFAGHVPAGVGLARALEARYRTIDHLDGYLEALAGDGAPASQMFGLNLVGRLDESRMAALVARTKAAGVAQVPTQALLEHWVGPDSPEAMAAWPEMRFVPKAQLAEWTTQKRGFSGGASAEDREQFLAVRRRLLKQMHDQGVTLLLGSDGPQVWNVPGASVHRELQYLVRAGLSPWAALETGTRAVARFFGTADRGTVEQGKRADLLVVDANPLADVANASRIAGVMLGGRWLSRDALDARLHRIAADVNP
jgi:imidazolonepropionase-like amidohydrolase